MGSGEGGGVGSKGWNRVEMGGRVGISGRGGVRVIGRGWVEGWG